MAEIVLKDGLKPYYVCVSKIYTYMASTPEEAKELFYNDQDVPDIFYSIDSIKDMTETLKGLGDDCERHISNTKRVLRQMLYEEEYNEAVVNSLMHVSD